MVTTGATQFGAARPARVLVVEDHPIVRERLAELIGREPDMVVCGEAEDVRGALERVEALRPDVAVVDITLKDSYGIDLIKAMRERWPGVPVLVLSMHDEMVMGERALRAGARGYLNKREATGRIVPAIRTVLGGGVYASEAMGAAILDRIVGGGRRVGGGDVAEALSDREFEVFQMIGQGKGVREIAGELFLSVKTVEAHREHIKRKLGLRSGGELVHSAVRYMVDQRGRPPAGGTEQDRENPYRGGANA